MSENDHPHEPIQSNTNERRSATRIRAIYALLEERKLIDRDRLDQILASVHQRTPAEGAKVVARAWVDPAYKTRLLADPKATVNELIDADFSNADLIVVENTPTSHNLVVCTLCSCYPTPVLGVPPDWYKSLNYRSRAVQEPRAVLAEFGLALPDDVDIHVWDSTADIRYLVLPMRPAGTDGLAEGALAALVTRDSMIGTGIPKAPEPVAS